SSSCSAMSPSSFFSFSLILLFFFFFFFTVPAPPEIYTLSLHDALPILQYFGTSVPYQWAHSPFETAQATGVHGLMNVPAIFILLDRKSTRLNSSHSQISYAVFCLKKKKKKQK